MSGGGGGGRRRAKPDADRIRDGELLDGGKGRPTVGWVAAVRDLDAEAAILGGIILRPDILSLLPQLETDDFFDAAHKAVFGAMRNLESRELPIDPITLEDELAKAGKFDAIGGPAVFGELVLRVPTTENVEHYAAITKRHSISRKVLVALSELVELAKAGELQGDELVTRVIEAMRGVETGGKDNSTTIGAAAIAEYKRLGADLDTIASGGRVLAGIPFGLRPLDEMLGGSPLSVLTVVAARPSMGKTTFGEQLCWAAYELADDTSLFFSFEDDEASFAQRRLARESGVSTQDIKRRSVDRDKMRAITNAIGRAGAAREILIPCAGMTVDDLIREIRKIRMRPSRATGATTGTIGKRVVVDYLSKIKWPAHAKTEYEALSYASLALSNAAQTEGISIVALQQLNRDATKRDDPAPRLSDLRGSGRIEEDCKLALGLHWPHYYDSKEPANDYLVFLLKNSNGEARNRAARIYADMATHSLADSEIELLSRRRRSIKP